MAGFMGPLGRPVVFVFGSNREGRHGKGAALAAQRYHGAARGVAEGPTGRAYAITTKELRPGQPSVTLADIGAGITKFLTYARQHPGTDFRVVELGCGLAGHLPRDIAPLFLGYPPNVKLPATFLEVLKHHAAQP